MTLTARDRWDTACILQVYHPNIDLDGNICLNILREDWKPVLSINSVIYGLNFLFIVRLPLQPLLAAALAFLMLVTAWHVSHIPCVAR